MARKDIITTPETAMTDLNALKASNERRWANARVTRSFSAIARHLVAPEAKTRYKAVSAKTGVPWPIIAVIHERECSQNWSGSLAQGDPWNKVSIHVPAGRGPFSSWEECAVDALVSCPPYAARNKDWSVGAALTKLEEYNGLGYAARGRPSPYVWSGTDQYVAGKYVRDGVYDPNVVDGQLGCAGLLMAMMTLDPEISFASAAAAPTSSPAQPKEPKMSSSPATSKPSLKNPSKGSIGAFIAALLSGIFRRK
jgi:lysozyme family protein